MNKKITIILSSIILISLICFIILCLYIYTIQAYRDWGYICQNTCSQKGYREWMFGFITNQWEKKSDLEIFIEKEYNEELEFSWCSYAGTGKNILGVKLLFGHGRPSNISFYNMKNFNLYFKTLNKFEKYKLYQMLKLHDKDKVNKEHAKFTEKIYP